MRGTGILLENDFDLKIQVKKDGLTGSPTNGKIMSGLVIGDTLFQNQALILLFQQGELKLSPVTGVGFDNSLLDNGYLSWKRRIRKQMERDGQVVRDVKISATQKLVIDAGYH